MIFNFVIVLFLIYGPRLFGSLFVDFSILTIFIMFFLKDYRISKYTFYIIIIIFLFNIYQLFIVNYHSTNNFSHIFKYIRVLINGFSVIVFFNYLFNKYSQIKVFYLVISVITFHSVILILQNFIPTFDNILTLISGYEGSSKRPTGLTWSLNATSIVSSISIFLLFHLYKNNQIRFDLFFIPLIVILFSMSLTGRTTFFVTVFFILIYFLYNKPIRSIVLLTFFCFILINFETFILIYYPKDGIPNQLYQYLQISQLITGQINFEDTSYLSPLVDTLFSFLIFPNDFNLIFGSGISGREFPYVKSDLGWVLLIHQSGIVGLLFIFIIFCYALYYSKESDLYFLLLLLILLMCFINFKENVLFSRHVSTIFFILLTAIDYDKKNIP